MIVTQNTNQIFTSGTFFRTTGRQLTEKFKSLEERSIAIALLAGSILAIGFTAYVYATQIYFDYQYDYDINAYHQPNSDDIQTGIHSWTREAKHSCHLHSFFSMALLSGAAHLTARFKPEIRIIERTLGPVASFMGLNISLNVLALSAINTHHSVIDGWKYSNLACLGATAIILKQTITNWTQRRNTFIK